MKLTTYEYKCKVCALTVDHQCPRGTAPEALEQKPCSREECPGAVNRQYGTANIRYRGSGWTGARKSIR